MSRRYQWINKQNPHTCLLRTFFTFFCVIDIYIFTTFIVYIFQNRSNGEKYIYYRIILYIKQSRALDNLFS